MDMKFQAFGGRLFRPLPEVLVKKDTGFFAIATPWGPRSQTKEMIEFLAQSHSARSSDREVTSVYPFLKSLSPEENIFRQAVLACNEWIFKEQNKESEYTFGYEMVCGVLRGERVLIIQAGHPYIYLDRPGISLQSIGHVLDLSSGFSDQKEKTPPPLPSRLLGLYADTHCSVFTVPIKKGDRLFFISRSVVPVEIVGLPRAERGLNFMARKLAEDNKDLPFWIALMDLF